MLFYESAKCMHGRPSPLKGRYYSSIFIHFLPADWPLTTQDAVYAVPPTWGAGKSGKQAAAANDAAAFPPLSIHGTGFKEYTCPHGWCTLSTNGAETVVLSGRASDEHEAEQAGAAAAAALGGEEGAAAEAGGAPPAAAAAWSWAAARARAFGEL